MKEIKFIKITCGRCGALNLIPVVNGAAAIEDIVKCEKCEKVIAITE